MNWKVIVAIVGGIIAALILGTVIFKSSSTGKINSTGKLSDNTNEWTSTNSGHAIAYKNITSKELAAQLASKDFFFVNVHIPYEGEIEKTDVFISYDDIENNLDKLPQDKNAKIVLYCRSGRMSAIAAQNLANMGYTNVFNHLGGMIDWEQMGYKVIPN